MIFTNALPRHTALLTAIDQAYRADETRCVENLLPQAQFSPAAKQRIHAAAAALVNDTRARQKQQGSLHAFLHEYDLSSDEGIALMCLAEALLRIPDSATADKLISDRLAAGNWQRHSGSSDSLFVNAATWSLILTGKLLAPTLNTEKTLSASLQRLLARSSATVIRPMIMQGMKQLGRQFVMGTTITEALKRAKEAEAQGYRYSYDMLGEAARTAEDAERYFQSYLHAIQAISAIGTTRNPIESPGISIKLSALHPRYELAQRERVLNELLPRLEQLVAAAATANINLTIDAEEAERLTLSLEILELLMANPATRAYQGLGLAVQAYQKRAPYVIDWLADRAKFYGRRLMVRLIKGAYWDSEIKLAQVGGQTAYPVYTRKAATDVSWLACARKLLSQPDCFYPQFGTHNAYSVAAILDMAGDSKDFEFQCLHGMGQSLYDGIVPQHPCRIYAPVGTHRDLLSYLVRRLLENGANSSFINLMGNLALPIDEIISDPAEKMAALTYKPHPKIPLPRDIYGAARLNSTGMDLSDPITLSALKTTLEATAPHCSYDVTDMTATEVTAAIEKAYAANDAWAHCPAAERAACLDAAADLFEKNMPQLMTYLTLEAGKQIADCVSEVREAIDFCRYYAAEARRLMTPVVLNGPTGELNQLSLHARGSIVCISPWNFPLAIFIGQVVAALAVGNTVLAKPAEQTRRIAIEAVKILHQAGIPSDVVQIILGSGSTVGAQLIADTRTAGVMFTGSTATARLIQRTLAARDGAIIPLIAETGGQNTMIVDSSALPEQVVADVIQSAFNSAGQRCSALRVLFIQQDIAERVIDMLLGAMRELRIGDPTLLATDVGPVIDAEAQQKLQQHVARMHKEAKVLLQLPTPNSGTFFGPCAIELPDLTLLPEEVFGPVLHIIRYASKDLDQVMAQIRATGYGLTLGVHSRIAATIDYISSNMPVGNIYINRNMIGATVGVQPFGGEGLSGTGPKAGGPHYLPRLCVERALSINTTAAGGNTSLVSLQA